MSGFVIYEDQENVTAATNAKKNKEVPTKNRIILGTINENSNNAVISTALQKKNTNVSRGESTQKGVHNKEKDAEETIGSKCDLKNKNRSPLGELNVNEVGVLSTKSKESPMVISTGNSPDSPISGNTSSSKLKLPTSVDVVTQISDTDSPLPEVLPDHDNTHVYSGYEDDIYKYLREVEAQNRPKAYYMRRQPDITYSMRAVLIDWLVEVVEEYNLQTETLFIAVSYIDRFLSTMAVVRGKLQLLGTSAMFIASKYEEIYPPEVAEFTYITDDTYSKKQVLRMEHLILKVLSFNLSRPTAYTFVVHLSTSVKLPHKIKILATYLCELGLLEADPYLELNPSLVACGAIALARHILGYTDVWPSSLATASGYNIYHLASVVTHLHKTHIKPTEISRGAIREKYSSNKYHQVALIPPKKLIIRERELS